MNAANLVLAEGLVSKSYVRQGAEALARHENLVTSLLSSRKLPKVGWDDSTIELFVKDLALMDSNNFLSRAGVGEREARCASKLVHRRHYGLAHGIGRSGNISDEQPKAAGSSLLLRLCNLLVAHALDIAGLKDIGAVTVLPLATGLSLTMSMIALKQQRPPQARYVLWLRIDQKSALKAIATAGLEIVVVPGLLEGDEVRTDLAALTAEVQRLGADKIVCVLSTTSCFATRGHDRVEEIAKLCEREGIGHIINNAYGVQSAELCSTVTRAWRRGRVDAVVQSTDKNFMVPVGGAVIAAGKKRPGLVEAVSALYPGRASVSTHLDLFITLLSLGVEGWQKLLEEREQVFKHLKQRLGEVAEAHGERLLQTPHNPISLAMTLDTLERPPKDSAGRSPPSACCEGSSSVEADNSPLGQDGQEVAFERTVEGSGRETDVAGVAESAGCSRGPADEGKGLKGREETGLDLTFFGSMLFSRCVSGCRIIKKGERKKVCGIDFAGYGASYDKYPHSYMTAAAALGASRDEVDVFIDRLVATLKAFKKKMPS